MDQKIAEKISSIEAGRENRAVTKFQKSSERHRAMLAKQQEFEEYRDEYNRQITELGRQGVDSDTLASYHQFKDSLDTAIEQHGDMVEGSRHQVEANRADWSASRIRQKALRQLIDDQNRENLIQEEKRNQKLIDDICALAGSH